MRNYNCLCVTSWVMSVVSQWRQVSSKFLFLFFFLHSYLLSQLCNFSSDASITLSYLLSSATRDTCMSAIKPQLSSSCHVSATTTGSMWKRSLSKPVKFHCERLMRKKPSQSNKRWRACVCMCVCVWAWSRLRNRCMAGSCGGGRSSRGSVHYAISDSRRFQSHLSNTHHLPVTKKTHDWHYIKSSGLEIDSAPFHKCVKSADKYYL